MKIWLEKKSVYSSVIVLKGWFFQKFYFCRLFLWEINSTVRSTRNNVPMTKVAASGVHIFPAKSLRIESERAASFSFQINKLRIFASSDRMITKEHSYHQNFKRIFYCLKRKEKVILSPLSLPEVPTYGSLYFEGKSHMK